MKGMKDKTPPAMMKTPCEMAGSMATTSDETIPPRLIPETPILAESTSGRLASQLAFMMIEYTRRDATTKYGATHGEFGWILEDNKGMLSIAQLPSAKVNHRYRIFEKAL